MAARVEDQGKRFSRVVFENLSADLKRALRVCCSKHCLSMPVSWLCVSKDGNVLCCDRSILNVFACVLK